MPFTDPQQLHDTFADALAAADVEALLDLYEQDAVQLQPDGTQLTGREALRAVITRLLTARAGRPRGPTEGRTKATVVAGDIALTSTRYPPTEPGAPEMVTAEVSRRGPGGEWHVVIDAPFLA